MDEISPGGDVLVADVFDETHEAFFAVEVVVGHVDFICVDGVDVIRGAY